VNAPQREAHQDAGLARLRELVNDQGEAIAELTRREAALEKLLTLASGGRPADPELSPYDQAAAVQARRQAFYVVPKEAAR
jgi:hypothetical protein